MTSIPELRIPEAELPTPGETIHLTVGQYEVLVVHTGSPDDEPAEELSDDPIGYSAVTGGAAVVHAAAVYQRAQRTRAATFTLCSRNKSRRSGRRLLGVQLTAVTCTQCRRHLEAEGAI